MSRSYKKVSHWRTNAGSFKEWKRQTNRRFRSRAKQVINNCKDWDELILPLINEVDTLWSSPRDGIGAGFDKPYENECERNLEHSIRRGLVYTAERQLKEMAGNNGHLKRCDCLHNKNNYYWKGFRK